MRGSALGHAWGTCGDQGPPRWDAFRLMNMELRVLIADDEPAALSGLSRRLSAMAGVSVVATCRHGNEALERIRATRPDAAFLDVAMPGLSGLDVVRALAPPERPHIVFVTAF